MTMAPARRERPRDDGLVRIAARRDRGRGPARRRGAAPPPAGVRPRPAPDAATTSGPTSTTRTSTAATRWRRGATASRPGRSVVAGRRASTCRASFPDGTAIHGQVSRRPWARGRRRRVPDRGRRRRLAVAATRSSSGFRIDGDDRLELGSAPDEPVGRADAGRDRVPPLVPAARPGGDRAASVHPSNLATRRGPVPVAGRYDRTPARGDAGRPRRDLGGPRRAAGRPRLAGGRHPGDDDASTRRAGSSSRPACPGSDAVAVEPQTHAPDGIRRLLRGEPGGLALIPPGESLELVVAARLRADPEAESRLTKRDRP